MVHEQADQQLDNRADGGAFSRRDWIEHIRQQNRITTSIVSTLLSTRTSLENQRDSIRANKHRLNDVEARLQVLEEAQRARAEAAAAPASASPGDPLADFVKTENGRFLCPRCGKSYVQGYILKHVANLKNKNCVYPTQTQNK